MNMIPSTQIFLSGLIVALAAIPMVGIILVISSTIRRKGKWGVNFSTIRCPRCNSKLAAVRFPASPMQALWGGGTCKSCACEVDKWGVETTLQTQEGPK